MLPFFFHADESNIFEAMLSVLVTLILSQCAYFTEKIKKTIIIDISTFFYSWVDPDSESCFFGLLGSYAHDK